MKNAGTKIEFKNDKVTMLGQKQDLIITRGHYAIPLGDNQVLTKIRTNKDINITLNLKTLRMGDKAKVAIKLHIQLAHLPAHRLMKLIREAGLQNDIDLKDEITRISASCEVCSIYKRPNPRPIVGLLIATEFNEVVAMNLKEFNGRVILHLIDHARRFLAVVFIKSKERQEIIMHIFNIWISIFEAPRKFFSDNSGEFSNKDYNEMCELSNKVKKTSAESPFSNGLCWYHNAVLVDTLIKVSHNKNIAIDIYLQWEINAKNSYLNVHGYFPYQLVFGKNPNLPSVLTNNLPALGITNIRENSCEFKCYA